MSDENWLQRTIDTPKVIDKLKERYGKAEMDRIGTTDAYKDAEAALGNALAQALAEMNMPRKFQRHKTQMGQEMLDVLLNAVPVVFLLGHSLGTDEAMQEIERLKERGEL